MSNPAVSVGAQAVVPLTAGTTYVFGAIIDAGAAVTLMQSSCTGTVTIAREAP